MNFDTRKSRIAGYSRHLPEEGDLPQKVRSGSVAAFEALFHTYYSDMVSFATYHIHRVDVAEELVQEVFLSIWRNRHTWRPEGTLRTYFLGAARKESLQHLRRKKVEAKWEERQPEANACLTPEDSLDYKELSAAVSRAIAAMPERRRMIFTLSRQRELSHAEIAALLDISPKTVENQISHALRFLRQRLGPLLPCFVTLILYTT